MGVEIREPSTIESNTDVSIADIQDGRDTFLCYGVSTTSMERTMGASRKGPLDERVKTDLRMPMRVLREVDDLCHKLGMSKNTFFTMATVLLVVQLTPLLGGKKKRQTMIGDLEALFQKVMGDAKRAA